MMVQDHKIMISQWFWHRRRSPEMMTGVMGHLAGAGLLLTLLILQS